MEMCFHIKFIFQMDENKEEDNNDYESVLDITPVATRARGHQSPPLMEQIDLKHPFSLSIIGTTGSGKTVLAVNLLTRDEMYGSYFDEIHLFGHTVKSDDSWKVLKLPDKFIHSHPKTLIRELKDILTKQRKEVEVKGVLRCKKICLVFEDATTNRKLLSSPQYIQAYVQNRHYACSTIAMCHKYHAQKRVCRLNSNHIMIFPATMSEIKRIIMETQPAHLSKEEYEGIIKSAMESSPEMSHPFLWLNFKVQADKRIRKGLRFIL